MATAAGRGSKGFPHSSSASSIVSSVSSSSSPTETRNSPLQSFAEQQSPTHSLSSNRAGRSGKVKHALFFSSSSSRRAEETQPLRPSAPAAAASTSSFSARRKQTPTPLHFSQQKQAKMKSAVRSLSGSTHDIQAIVDPGRSRTNLAAEDPDQVELIPPSPASRLSRTTTMSSSNASSIRNAGTAEDYEVALLGRSTHSAAEELQGAFGFGSREGPPGRHPPPGTIYHSSSTSSLRTVQERRSAYWRSAVLNLLLIASWYFFSTLISLYNKWMFDKKHYNFAYPLFVTCFHMIVQAVLSSLALCIFERQLVAKRPNGRRERPSLMDWTTKVVPCGLATALDIGLSNLSLKTITLTFYTMCKSSNLAFVLCFAFLFRLEKLRLSLIGIITLITIGVIMMVAAETKFVLVGAIEVLTASAMGGLRWALAQMLLDGRGRSSGMGMAHNPIATIFWLAPVMAVSMAVASMLVEDWRHIFASRHFHNLASSIKTLGLVTAPGVLAFCMHLSEFALIQRTSVVTLSVAGIFKEVSTIILASTIFGDELTPINVTGLCITILGIALYNWLKYQQNVNVPTASTLEASGGSSADVSLYGGTNTRQRGDYTQIFDRDAVDEDDEDDDGGRRRERRTHVIAGEDDEEEEEITPEEAERRRKRDEEAEMDGWAGAGTVQTGNGWYEQ
ncbi:hypothetical protein OC846_003710 [Tilletia horrida]|uniref:Sugar phosphate transporter domain-containing protein n=1 Tax=Tilletia horrida TaxID=155126 RepID=A0AAN6GPN2_9BASI|nr:hypothetical protein OC846_003710 [Tilletia horrida]KAK0565456.1 hypothetical protein OC861_003754 [Tilletia horrida]